MRKLYAKLLLFVLFLLPMLSQAQTIQWNFGTATPFTDKPFTAVIPGIPNPTLRSGNSLGNSTLLSSTSASTTNATTGYATASGGGNAGVAAAGGALVTGAGGSAYFEFTLSPSSSQSISISEIDFGTRSTGTGPTNYDLRTSLDNYASAVATGTITTSNTPWALKTNATTIAGALGQAITIRIYGYGNPGSPAQGTVTWRIDDLAATVAVTNTIPLPTITPTGTLTTFTTNQGTASTAQTITVNGSNLTGPIAVVAPGGYEVSRDGTTFGDFAPIPAPGGTVSGATVFVRLKASAGAGVVNGNLSLSTAGNNVTETFALTGTVTASAPISVVINQVYGGGGNSGAIYLNDFVELYNNNTFPVSLNGWSVQYASSTGTSWQITTLTGIIPAKGFYLVSEAAGANASATPLPQADDAGTIAMSGTSGKVVLSNSTTAFTVADPTGATLMDKVGYGDAANGRETTPTPDMTDNNTSIVRKVDGADAGNNSTDFKFLTPPNPRNTGFTTTPPSINFFHPSNGNTDVPVNFVPFVIFSKPVVKGSGNITLSANGTPMTIDVNDPRIVINSTKLSINQPLTGNINYDISIDAGAVKDEFGNNYPGVTPGNWTFVTYNNTVSVVPDYTNNFENCSGTGLLPGGFTQYSAIGDQVWDCTTFGRDPAAPAGTAEHGAAVQINGFANNVNNVNEDWLISPKLDLTDATGKFALLSFWSRSAFSGSQLQLKVSTDYTGTGNPNAATWTDLNGRFPGSNSNVWTLSDNINLTAYKQDGVYVAFVYTSTTDDGSRWTIDDIKIAFSTTPPPPTITISATNVEFGFAANGNTVDKKVTVIGNDLTTDIKVAVASGANFLVSTDSVTFSNTITIGHDTANNKLEPIFIRFTPNIANSQFFDSLKVYIGPDATPDTAITINLKGNSISPASTLSVVNWNMEWFATAEPGFGPKDKALQMANATTVLQTLKADLFVLEEIVNTDSLKKIVASMPGYDYVVNNYGSHANNFDPTHFDISTSQKLAFVFNTSKIKNIQTDSLLNTAPVNTAADVNTPHYNDWAGGRYPYMLTADVILDDNAGGSNTKRVHFIDIHAKANTGDLTAAYNSRKNGAFSLDSLIRTVYPSTDNFLILGDYNDDLNHTITSDPPSPNSSYSPFTIDHPTDYIFPTQLLSQQGQHSDVNFTGSVIDNVIVNKNMSSWYLPSSATVLSDVATLIPKYGTTTSDHYPMFTQFSFTPPIALPVKLLSFTAVRQDATAKLSWTTTKEDNSAFFEIQRSGDNKVFATIGTVAAQGNSSATTHYGFIDQQPLTGNNYYRLNQVDRDVKSELSKTVVLNFGSSLTLRISPNPAHGTAYLIIGSANDAFSIRIIDLNGRMVQQYQTTPGTASIPMDVSKLAKGIYSVKVTSASTSTTQKLVVR